ncbi:MAG: hypothetical protein R8K22_05115, partial [Mariprofundaceae bacterium]
MPLSPMLRHPVGRLPSAARWYLAAMAMLALVLVAAHFAMQIQAQHEAKKLVANWTQEEENIHVDEVRYRMLRGALTLLNVQLQQPNLNIQIPSIELHGLLSSLQDEQPFLETLRIQNATLQLTDAALLPSMLKQNLQALYHDGITSRLWRAAQHVQLSNIHIQWPTHVTGPLQTSIVLQQLQLTRTEGMQRALKARIQLFEGDMHISATEVDDQLQSGGVEWNRLNANNLLITIPRMKAVTGLFSGKMNWTSSDKNMWNFEGKTRLKREGAVLLSKLDIKGHVKADKWQAKILSSAWPLAMLTSYLPESGGFHIVDGTIDGEAKFTGDMKKSRLFMEKAELRHMQIQSINNDSHSWKLGQGSLKVLTMRWPAKTLRLENLQLSNGELPITAAALPLDWKGSIHKIHLQQMKPFILVDDQEVLRLPMIKGQARWVSSQGLSMKLRTYPSDEPSNEFWRVSGNLNDQIKIKCRNTPASRFRAWLPEILRESSGSLVGKVSSKLTWSQIENVWQLRGQMKLSDAEIQIGSDHWLLQQTKIKIGKAGPGLSEQWIDSINVQGWHYQVGLKPLSVIASEVASPSFALLEKGWRIDSLEMKEGVMSAGSADSIWMKHISLQVNPMRTGVLSNVSAYGSLNDGEISLNSSFDPFSPGFQPKKIKASIRNALPFFIGDWLEVSGIPRLTRGRLHVDMSAKAMKKGGYQGNTYLRLNAGSLAEGTYLNDPMVSYAGFQSQDLLTRLNQKRQIRLKMPIKTDVLNWQVLGQALLLKLQNTSPQKQAASFASLPDSSPLFQAHLHINKRLSLNERTRLRKTIIELKQHPKWMIELQPQISAQPLDQSMINQVRYTQDLLTTFMADRGISRSRIFP